MPIKKIISLIFLLAIPFLLNSQDFVKSLRCKWVKVKHEPFQIDSLSIEQSTIEVKAVHPESINIKSLQVSYDINQNKILFSSLNDQVKIEGIDSVFICYRVFPFNLSAPYYGKRRIAFDSTGYLDEYHFDVPETIVQEKREELFATEGITKTGSLTRGISVGNAQNVFVNSALNLQLDGKLSDDISITAAISDQNVPFQPDGNTQQLQDFDKVFIQLKHKKGDITAGDIVLKNEPDSYFLKFNKNVQGVQLNATLGDTTKNFAKTQIGVAVAKGQFYSQKLEVQEGVLGPYRLSGPGIERFVVVIANSERVFLDGKLLQRGYNYDYVIDYNAAEITLTNKIVITKYSRLRVDFEYASQNYSRSILQASHKQKIGKFTLGTTFYQEKDNRNNPILTSLNEESISALALAGDQLENAVSQSIDTLAAFDNNRVIYTAIDTLVDGTSYSIFRRATQDDELFLTVGFSETGQGNYILASTTTNGRVYAWVAPQNGVPQGTYEPVIQIPAPNKRQIISFRPTFDINDKEQFYAEIAFSTFDQNLFSNLDSEDDKGLATKIGYTNKGRDFKLLSGYKWLGNISYEFDHKNFTRVDRFRSVDYDRDWSVDNQVQNEDQIINGTVGIRKNNENTVSYNLAYRKRGNQEGFQHTLNVRKRLGILKVSSNAFLMNNDQEITKSEWQKFIFDVSIPKSKIVPGYVYSMDRNKVFQVQNDSIVSSAMNFDEHKVYLKSGNKSKATYQIDYAVREDKTPLLGELQDENLAHTLNFSYKRNTSKNLLNLLFSYRKLENLNGQLNNEDEETIMGRIDWKASFFDKSIRSSLNFNTASGRERKREFVFVQVATGLGTHTWRDDNEDGIQDLSEFYLAINPDEKNYAKFFVPTSEFIQAYSSSINYRLNIQPPRSWLKAKGGKSVLGRFSNVTALVVQMRTTDNDVTTRLVPFFRDVEDENLLASNSQIRSTLFYNRKNPRSGMEFQVLKTRNKQLLNNGFDDVSATEYGVTFRMNIKKTFNFKTKVELGEKENISDVFENRNYRVSKSNFNPIITFQPNKNLRFTTSYFYKVKNNQSAQNQSAVNGLDEAIFNEIDWSIRWVKSSRISARANFRLSEILLRGENTAESLNSAIGYEMLEALQPGTNISWKVNITSKLMNGLQLNFNYSGRKPENSDVIHIGRMQVTALF